MHINSHVSRTVSVRLDAAEMFRHTGAPRYRETERTADINRVAATVGEAPNGGPRVNFTIEGPNINRDGTQGAVYRRFEMSSQQAALVLPPHVYDAVIGTFNEQGCPPVTNHRPQHPSER
jgi:hypothetical protein